jgi:hypothetical protein
MTCLWNTPPMWTAIRRGTALAAIAVAACDSAISSDLDAVTQRGGKKPTLIAVELSPDSATVPAGSQLQFSVLGRRSDGSTTSVLGTFGATGGQITSGGLYNRGANRRKLPGLVSPCHFEPGGHQPDRDSSRAAAAAPAPATAPTPATSAARCIGGKRRSLSSPIVPGG